MVVAITPWNAPLVLLCYKVAAALAAGLATGRITPDTPVGEAMEPALPGVGARTGLRAAALRLQEERTLLVMDAGVVQGVVTLHDVLAYVTA